jgi:hypothetical protein
MMAENQDARVQVTGTQGNYQANVVPQGKQWELHYGDSITLTVEWLGQPRDAAATFIDVNISRPGVGPGPSPGHIVDGIRSSNGKYHDPTHTWEDSPGPGWWGGGSEATIYRQKDTGEVPIYKIGGVAGQENGPTTGVITDVEELGQGMEDNYYFSGRVRVIAADGANLGGASFDPVVVNKGSGGRR